MGAHRGYLRCGGLQVCDSDGGLEFGAIGGEIKQVRNQFDRACGLLIVLRRRDTHSLVRINAYEKARYH